MTQLVWTGIKHAIDASITGYGYAKKDILIPLGGGSEKLQTPPQEEQGEEQEKEQGEEKEQVEYTGLNLEAFKMWCTHKGKSYSKQGKTLSRNMLMKHDMQTQIDMVEKSIMNNYAGLFEPKITTPYKQAQNTTNSTIDKYFNGTAESEIIDARIN